MNFSIQGMDYDDLPFFNKVRNQVRAYLHDNREFSLHETEEWYLKTNPEYFIAKRNEEYIGYFRTSDYQFDDHDPRWEDIPLRASCYIGMDIDPKYQGLGFAKLFYYIFFIYLRDNCAITDVYLEVLENNIRAFQLYKDLGFKVIDEKEILERGRSFKMHRELK